MNITNRGLLIGAGVVALGIGVGVYLGKRKAKKNKEKESENEIAEMKRYEEQMRKQAEEEQAREEECNESFKTTDEMIKKAETVEKEHPITREDLVEAITRDPAFGDLLMKYISPVEAMAMKHMPSRNDVKEECKEEPVTANNGSDNLTEPYSHGVIPMHIVNHKEGIEYDAYPPVNSINDIKNIKPLNTEPVKKTLVDQANEIREEFDNAIKSLSEDDQLAIANRILNGAFIAMCGKQVQLSDLTIMKADMNQISEKVLAFILGNTYRIDPNILHSSVRDTINNIIGTPNTNNQIAKEDNSNINAYEYELQRLTVEQQFTIMSKLLSGETVTIADRKVELTDLPAVRNNASLLSPEFQAYVANMVNKQVSAPQPSAPITPSVQTFAVPFTIPSAMPNVNRFGNPNPAESAWKTNAAAANMWIKNYKN